MTKVVLGAWQKFRDIVLCDGANNLQKTLKGASKNQNFVILSEAKNLLFRESKKQILRPAVSE